MEHYRRSQTGYPILLTGALVALLVVAVTARPAFALAVVALVVALFWRLTVNIDSERLTCAFGFGLIRRTIPLAEIEDCTPIVHRWYWGYGIRLTPQGVVYTVGGSDAVRFTLRSGRRFSIGTSEPRELCEAVRKGRMAIVGG